MNNPFAFLCWKYTPWKLIEVVEQEDAFQSKYHYGMFIRKNIDTGMINFKRKKIINARCKPKICTNIESIYDLINAPDFIVQTT